MAATSLRPRSNPTNADIVSHLVELHDCLNKVGEDVAEVKERVAKVEGFQAGVSARLGVPSDPEAARRHRPAFLFMGRWKAGALIFSTIFGAISAAAAAYPALHNIGVAVDHALMTPAPQ